MTNIRLVFSSGEKQLDYNTSQGDAYVDFNLKASLWNKEQFGCIHEKKQKLLAQIKRTKRRLAWDLVICLKTLKNNYGMTIKSPKIRRTNMVSKVM